MKMQDYGNLCAYLAKTQEGTWEDAIAQAKEDGTDILFIDTAGLRESGDTLEIEGIRRSHAALAQADLILHVLDNSEPLAPEDARFLTDFTARKRIVVLNKSDLPSRLELPADATAAAVKISCTTCDGIEVLKNAIKQRVWSGEITAEMLEVMISARHRDALRRAREAAVRASAALRENLTLELVALDLRIAVNAVGEVVGKTTTEDLLDSIFSQFCIGK